MTERVRAELGSEHPLVSCLRSGIAFHHAALPTDVLEAIEDALRSERIRAVVSTTTLTDGVNLPVRTVVITAALDDDQRPQVNGVPGLDAAKLLNAVGRAGRAGRESEGWILLALNRRIKSSDHELFTPAAEDLRVESALTREQALVDLAAAEQLIAESADSVMAVTESLASDFITYVWFVLDAHDHLATDAPPLDAVDRLLAMQQLPPEIKTRWQRLAQKTQEHYLTTASETRRRWTTTGTSLSSARALDNMARRLAVRVLNEPALESYSNSEGDDPEVFALGDTLRLLDEELAFTELLKLPERRSAWMFYDRRATRNRQAINVDVREAMRAWIDGTPIPALARQWLPDAETDWALEQAVANISTTFEHYLSWTLGALIHMTNEHLSRAESPLLLRPDTAWHLRYGVDTEQAIHLLTRGVHSRALAHAIGRQADAQGIPSSVQRQWLADQHISGWRSVYAPSDLEIEDLLEYVRIRRRSLLRGLLRDGSISIEVDVIGPIRYSSATLRWSEDNPAQEIDILDAEGDVCGRVRAGDHLDVTAVLRSGLRVTMDLQREQLYISRS
ncbi:helicase-related protein [Glycomyces niveus]|uniref:helicase-related protein n=1 Tax=Glycomyces niveus TaxID=2820287 RepID=UPI001FBB674C|nr:helicase-related protein [Glycomyces sp. NEAU-S30]